MDNIYYRSGLGLVQQSFHVLQDLIEEGQFGTSGVNIVGFYVLKLIVCKQKHIIFSIKLLLLFIQ